MSSSHLLGLLGPEKDTSFCRVVNQRERKLANRTSVHLGICLLIPTLQWYQNKRLMKLPAAKCSLKLSRLRLGCNERLRPEIVILSQLFQSIYVIVYLGEHCTAIISKQSYLGKYLKYGSEEKGS